MGFRGGGKSKKKETAERKQILLADKYDAWQKANTAHRFKNIFSFAKIAASQRHGGRFSSAETKEVGRS